ncbi:MAG TPA: hypothetical protein VLL05_05200 [Terriglobales bacterium]|nr:hypothetical protein [Terriglobales bacterium]
MLKFWRNPEFVRHVRSELRPARAMSVALVVLFLCGLIGLACWSEQQSIVENAQQNARIYGGKWEEHVQRIVADSPHQTWLMFCRWLFGLQAGLVVLWSLLMCSQSVSTERDRKTWDFQRTTSLTAAELAIGKVLGEPVLAYFGMLCALPVTMVAGLGARFSVWNILNGYMGLIACALFLGLCGLWLSILIEHRGRSVGLIGAAVVYAVVLSMYGFANSWFPGLAAFSPFSVLYRILGLDFEGRGYVPPMLLGHAVPWLLVSLLLDVSFGAWLVVMVLRNLKRDYPDIRPLSRWQAVGCAVKQTNPRRPLRGLDA